MVEAVDQNGAAELERRGAAQSKYLSRANSSTGRRSKSRGANRATQIIKTAEQLFYERGYSATSMDDLAQAVGILKGSLYYYVNSKEDLLFRIVETVHGTVEELLEEAESMADAGALERVLHYVRAQSTYNAENLAELAVYHHEWKRLEGERLERIQQEQHQHEQRMRALIKAAQKAGEIPSDTDLRLAVAHTFAVIIWPYTWYRPGGSLSAAKLADSAVRFVATGLGVTK